MLMPLGLCVVLIAAIWIERQDYLPGFNWEMAPSFADSQGGTTVQAYSHGTFAIQRALPPTQH